MKDTIIIKHFGFVCHAFADANLKTPPYTGLKIRETESRARHAVFGHNHPPFIC